MLFVFVLLAGAFFIPDAIQANISISALPEKLILGTQMDLLDDASTRLSVEEIRALSDDHWTKGEDDFPALGFDRSPQWIRFTLQNTEAVENILYLEAAAPWLDKIELFQGDNPPKAGGDTQPFSARDLEYHNVVFKLSIPPESSITYYLRVENEGTMILPFVLWKGPPLLHGISTEQILNGVFFGASLVMVCFFLFLFGIGGEKIYLHYVVFLLLILLWIFSLEGYLAQFVFPDFPEAGNRAPVFLICAMMVSAFGFARSFLKTRKKAPIAHRIFFVAQILFAVAAIPSALFPAIGTPFLSGAMLVVPLVMFPPALKLTLQGFRPAGFFLGAWTAVVLAGLLAPLRNAGLISITWLTQAVEVGVFAQMIILSLGLGDHINELRIAALQKRDDVLGMNRAFQKFVPRFTRYLHSDLKNLKLGQRVDIHATILFSDIRGFSRLAETMNSGDTSLFLNEYYGRLTPIIEKHEGFVDKYIGDSILAIFPESPDSALQAAIGAVNELEAFNEKRKENGQGPIKTGFGIHTGPITIATIGTENRLETTVIGDSVNIASRVEQLTKEFDSTIFLTAETRKNLINDSYHLREVARLRPRGKEEELTIFECFDTDPVLLKDSKKAANDSLIRGMKYLNDVRINAALVEFIQAILKCPADPVTMYHIRKCRSLVTRDQTKEYIPGVLILDDNPLMRSLLSSRFRGRRLRIATASSSDSARQLAAVNRFDAVVSDVMFGGSSGFDLISQLRQIDGTRRSVSFLLTTDDSQETASKAAQAGLGLFLKQRDLDIAIETIDVMLRTSVQ